LLGDSVGTNLSYILKSLECLQESLANPHRKNIRCDRPPEDLGQHLKSGDMGGALVAKAKPRICPSSEAVCICCIHTNPSITSEHIRKAENDHGVRPQGVLPANLCKQSLIAGNPTLHDDKCF